MGFGNRSKTKRLFGSVWSKHADFIRIGMPTHTQDPLDVCIVYVQEGLQLARAPRDFLYCCILSDRSKIWAARVEALARCARDRCASNSNRAGWEKDRYNTVELAQAQPRTNRLPSWATIGPAWCGLRHLGCLYLSPSTYGHDLSSSHDAQAKAARHRRCEWCLLDTTLEEEEEEEEEEAAAAVERDIPNASYSQDRRPIGKVRDYIRIVMEHGEIFLGLWNCWWN